MLEGLGLIRHIRRRHVHVRQGLTYGGGSRRSVFIRTREVSYRLPNLPRRRIEIRRCRLYFLEGVIDFLGKPLDCTSETRAPAFAAALFKSLVAPWTFITACLT